MPFSSWPSGSRRFCSLADGARPFGESRLRAGVEVCRAMVFASRHRRKRTGDADSRSSITVYRLRWADAPVTNGNARIPTSRRWLHGEHGQDLIEYVLVGAFVALVALGGASQFGAAVNDWYSAMGEAAKSGNNKSNCSARGMMSSNGKCHGG